MNFSNNYLAGFPQDQHRNADAAMVQGNQASSPNDNSTPLTMKQWL